MIRKRKPVDDVPLNSLWVANHRGKAFHVRVISSRSRSGVTLYKVANAYTNIQIKNEKMRSFLVKRINILPPQEKPIQKQLPENKATSVSYPCADMQDEKFTEPMGKMELASRGYCPECQQTPANCECTGPFAPIDEEE